MWVRYSLSIKSFSFHLKPTLSWNHLSMSSLTSSHFVDSNLRTMNSLCVVSLTLSTAILKSPCSSVVSLALPWKAVSFSQTFSARPKRISGTRLREILPRWQNTLSALPRTALPFAFASSLKQSTPTASLTLVRLAWQFVRTASMPTLSTSLLIK